MSFRYLICDTSGEVTGTNDEAELPDVNDSDDIVLVIDTQAMTYTNDDEDDAVIEQFEPLEDDDSEED